MAFLCVALFLIPLAAVPWVTRNYSGGEYSKNVCEALAAAWGTLLASLIVGFLIFSFQRRVEKAKFVQSIGDKVASIMCDQTAWLIMPIKGEQKAVPVDFRYAVGKVKWDSDPKELVCDKTDKHKTQVFHAAAHLPLDKKIELGINYPGLIYQMTPELLLASKSLHEIANQVWILMEALDSGVIEGDDLLTLWRPLDLFLPSYDRFALGRKVSREEYFQTESSASRWMEFFLFGNSFDEPVNNPKYYTFINMATALKRWMMYRVDSTVAKKFK